MCGANITKYTATKVDVGLPYTSFSDNQGAIDLMKNKISQGLNISNVYHFIREAIANGVLTKLVYCQFVYFMYMY